MQNPFLHSQGGMSQRGGKWNQHESALILILTQPVELALD